MNQKSNYDKQPTIAVSSDSSACLVGWPALARHLRRKIQDKARTVVVVECYPGVDAEEVKAGPLELNRFYHLCGKRAQVQGDSRGFLGPWLGSDPVFGRMADWELSSLFDAARTAELRSDLLSAQGLVPVYGTGAAYVANTWDLLLYCDVTRWEIQRRQRAQQAGNLGAGNASAPAAELYKRAYFVDWRAADTEKHRLHGAIDFYIDINLPDRPAMISGSNYHAALVQAVSRPFRVVPFFDPGPWGGQWMRRHFDLSEGPPNYEWCFDCVPEENSLRFNLGGNIVETPALVRSTLNTAGDRVRTFAYDGLARLPSRTIRKLAR